MRVSLPYTRGYSLTELLVVIALVGILAALALPGWQQQLQAARRVDATRMLLHLETRQAQFLLQHRRYATNSEIYVDSPFGLGLNRALQKNYEIRLTADTTGYLAVARPLADGPQIKDKYCRILTLDATGKRAALDQLGHDSTQLCWK